MNVSGIRATVARECPAWSRPDTFDGNTILIAGIPGYGRNEALDCRVYARAAASRVGIDRFQEKHWQQYERHLGMTPPKFAVAAASEKAAENSPRPAEKSGEKSARQAATPQPRSGVRFRM